jgi:hypothetical protein
MKKHYGWPDGEGKSKNLGKQSSGNGAQPLQGVGMSRKERLIKIIAELIEKSPENLLRLKERAHPRFANHCVQTPKDCRGNTTIE